MGGNKIIRLKNPNCNKIYKNQSAEIIMRKYFYAPTSIPWEGQYIGPQKIDYKNLENKNDPHPEPTPGNLDPLLEKD